MQSLRKMSRRKIILHVKFLEISYNLLTKKEIKLKEIKNQ